MFVDADAEEVAAESSNGERLAAGGDSQWRDVDRVQNEIDSLQRSFRSVESTRHSLRAKDPRPLRVRRRQFGKLKTQGQEARDNLRLESERAYTSVKHSISNRLAALGEQADRFHRAIAREKNTVYDIDAECNEVCSSRSIVLVPPACVFLSHHVRAAHENAVRAAAKSRRGVAVARERGLHAETTAALRVKA